MSPAENRAVFLSYASQDADAARRLCDALRAAGVEVWFDQSELRGGDAWDGKIRAQIASCALFVPVISANTQARREGYFRLEWKLADERTHLMAEGTPFILPVVVDATKEREALVPRSFLNVQWIWLQRDAIPPAFIERVVQLLGTQAPAAGRAPSTPSAPSAVPKPARRSVAGIALAALLLVGAAGAYFVFGPPAKRATLPQAESGKGAAPAVTSVSDKSIAVLPFTNLSDDRESGFFADGVQEDILTNLALIRELRVVSRTSVAQYRDTKKTMRDIGRELGVTYLLEGSVRKAAGSVRVTTQLIRAANDEHVWARNYDRELKDIFALQSALATEIAGALQAAVSPEERKLIARRPTENAAAYDLYLQARRIRDSGRNTRAMVEKQIALLEAAVLVDGNFALAWGDLAWCHGWMYSFRGNDRTPTRLEKATRAIDTAERLAAEAPETRLNRGYFYAFVPQDQAAAIREFEKLLAANPNNTPARFALGLAYNYAGNAQAALTQKLLAAAQDPGNGDYVDRAAVEARLARRHDDVERLLRRSAELNPDDPWIRCSLAWLEFDRRGSTREVDQFFATLPAAAATSLKGNSMRKSWALTCGNVTEALKLDRGEAWRQEDVEIGQAWVNDADDAIRMACAMIANEDRPRAIARMEPVRRALQDRLETEPGDVTALNRLGMIEALMGNRDKAVSLARNAIYRAFVLSWVGDKEAALAEYAALLAKAGARAVGGSRLNVHWMRRDAMFLPLRGDPRFEALLNDPKNNAPLF